MKKTVSIVIPTYNGGELFKECLASIKMQTVEFKTMLVVDSSSSDKSALLAKQSGFDVHSIDKKDFDHGGTRNTALNFIDSDYVVFMTQDAILQDRNAVTELISVFDNSDVDAVYGRQLPHDNANELAKYARSNSYTTTSYVTSLNDSKPKGFRKAFMSNSFSAYRVCALKELGGFPQKLILGEDSFIAAKVLLNNRSVAYSALAQVKHSHNYSLLEEFKRYFDTGVFHASESWMRDKLGSVEGEGVKFALGQIKFLIEKKLFGTAIYSLFSSVAKFTGYKLGLNYKRLPNSLCLKLSMYKGYFRYE